MVPTKNFDSWEILTFLKSLLEFGTLYVFFLNDFVAGMVLAGLGILVGMGLRFISNVMMEKELKQSSITTPPKSVKAFLNTIFGLRLGYLGLYERMKKDLEDNRRNQTYRTGEIAEAIAVDPNEEDDVLPPLKDIFGGSETVELGPRTLTAVAEIIQQTFCFLPTFVVFIEFGFGSHIKLYEVILVAAFFEFIHLMCWIVSPSVNVSYPYIYFSVWMCSVAPFLLILLISPAVGDFVVDSFYTRKAIYAWIKFGVICVAALVLTSLFMKDMKERVKFTKNYTFTEAPPILHGILISSLAFSVFEGICLLIVLANPKLFVYGDDQTETDADIGRLTGLAFANCFFTLWTSIVASIEISTITI